MSSVTEKFCTEQSSIKSVSNFLRQHKISADLKRAGAYKQKGIPVLTVASYLISLVYFGKSMFEDMRSENPLAQGFRRDVVYRFLNQALVNWQTLLLCIAGKVVAEFDRLTSADRLTAFVIDDSFYPALYAKATELVSLIHDHAEKGKNKYKWGFRMLALCWTDGVSLVPLAFRHLASADEKKQRRGVSPTLDKRSMAYRIRREAVSKATEVLLLQLKAAQKAGIAAKHVLFDSWFAYPVTIFKICALKLHVTARVKNTATLKYLVNGTKKTANEIYRGNRKRRGKSRYLLSVHVMLYTSEDAKEVTMPAKLVYVRNRAKRKEWIAILTTDTALSEEDVIAAYGMRWDIEVFFKVCKSYLKLSKEFQQRTYDAITAHTSIVFIRYIILSAVKRRQEDPRSLGALFYENYDEATGMSFERAILLVVSLLSETLREEHLGLTEEQMEAFMDAFIQKLPCDIQACLTPVCAA